MKVNQVQTPNCVEETYKVYALLEQNILFPRVKENNVDINILRKN